MVVIKDKSYLITHRVNLGQFFDKPEEDAYIVLREPDTFTLSKLRSAKDAGEESGGAFIDLFAGVLPDLIVDHDLYKSETQKLTAQEVRDFIYDKTEILTCVVGEYSTNVLSFLGGKSASK